MFTRLGLALWLVSGIALNKYGREYGTLNSNAANPFIILSIIFCDTQSSDYFSPFSLSWLGIGWDIWPSLIINLHSMRCWICSLVRLCHKYCSNKAEKTSLLSWQHVLFAQYAAAGNHCHCSPLWQYIARYTFTPATNDKPLNNIVTSICQ